MMWRGMNGVRCPTFDGCWSDFVMGLGCLEWSAEGMDEWERFIAEGDGKHKSWGSLFGCCSLGKMCECG